MRISVKCPYCEFENRYSINVSFSGLLDRQMITCDLENGGCDIPFVVTARAQVEARAWKIDWDDEMYPHIDVGIKN